MSVGGKGTLPSKKEEWVERTLFVQPSLDELKRSWFAYLWKEKSVNLYLWEARTEICTNETTEYLRFSLKKTQDGDKWGKVDMIGHKLLEIEWWLNKSSFSYSGHSWISLEFSMIKKK